MLRRGNRLKSIQASLAIENNTLSLEQVTAIINGKRVLGHPREIQEVKNAFAAYEMLEKLDPVSSRDLLKAHGVLMSALVDEAGQYRSGGVGIMKGKSVVHVAPPASRVPLLMNDLLLWLKNTDDHSLIASSVFHYEFEFIHPFADGNGRMGRLWQTLILSRWNPILAYLPVETVIRNRQDEYYSVLATSDQQADSTLFIEFMLTAIKDALHETIESDQDTDQVNDQVKRILKLLTKGSLSALSLMKSLGLSHRPTFRNSYLHPAIKNGFIEMAIPDKPNSRLQKYQITPKGIALLKELR
jgi:Fic family protein